MADCLGLCDYIDDLCQGCGRDFSLYGEEEKTEADASDATPENGAAPVR